jgi:hypothetical protein
MRLTGFVNTIVSQGPIARQSRFVQQAIGKRVYLLWVLLLAIWAHTALVQAQFSYATNNGTITITKYTGSGGVVTIPDSFDGLPVVNIGDLAFQGSSVTNLTIPSGITNLGNSTFSYCSGLTDIRIPDTVTSIPDSSFYFCFSLASIIIPQGVTRIGDGAFTFCTSLTNVSIGNRLSSIGNTAFFSCSNLTTITIPAGVTNIGDAAFVGCFALKAITVQVLNPSYSSLGGVLYNKTQTTLVQCPGAKNGSFTVPDSVTEIGIHAFAGCTSLTNLTIDNGVVSIGVGAFTSCFNLTSVHFWGNPPSIADGDLGFSFNTTIYYLPGNAWGSGFANVPTAVWVLPNPVILNTKMQTEGFDFTVSWATNRSVVVEATTNLTSPVWAPVATNSLNNQSFRFNDPQCAHYTNQFYRIRSQ